MPRSDFNFSFGLRVRYSETDMQGVVFNAHYLTYFDTAITEYIRWLDYDLNKQVEELGQDVHTVHAEVDFHSPCRYDQELDVCVRVGKLGRTSMTFGVEIFVQGEDEVKTSGRVIWVNTDMEEHRAKPWPRELIDLINSREA